MGRDERLIIFLDEVTPSDSTEIGGKAIGLGKLIAHGFPVPPGFVVTTAAYHRAVGNGLAGAIGRIVEGLDETTDNRGAAEQIQDLFLQRGLDRATEAAIRTAYERLGADAPVAVRSSATAEDRIDSSFAGQQETFLWISGADAVCRHVLECWASLFTAQAIGYRARLRIDARHLAMAVVIQRMVDAAAAGVMFTLDPTNGDRDRIYIEAAHGLGEAVVRGEVSPDRFRVDRTTGAIRTEISVKQAAYRFDRSAGVVGKLALDDRTARAPSISQPEAAALAELGGRVEAAFGQAMDLEWAVDGARQIFLLQARPETVWSRKPTRRQVEAVIGRHDAWDPLNQDSDPHRYWTTANVGEAIPGVLTPLSWTVWDGISDLQANLTFYKMGVFTRREIELAPVGQRKVRVFYGRAAADITLFTAPGDRMPGSSGRQIAEHIFGYVPDDLEARPTRRRWPVIFIKAPLLALSVERRLRRDSRSTDLWWKESIRAIPAMDKHAAIAAFTAARLRFYENINLQADTLMCAVQPMYQILERLVRRAGVGEAGALAGGYGGVPEVAVVWDLWRASRGEMTLEDVVHHHGYHAPLEGELSSKVWREDPAPLRKMLASYRARDDAASPVLRDAKRREERLRMERAILAATPAWKRPAVRWLLKLAERKIPLRGIGKNAFIQAFDVARAAARRVGECLAADGVLDEAEDVFMLTLDEFEAGPGSGLRALVALRKARWLAYKELKIPEFWQGAPTPKFAEEPERSGTAAGALRGIGVSAGTVEGRARVVLDPDFAGVEPDEVLVAPTTDPSWSSIMFISVGLVVDIGGAMSHAAVVARELGIPCVVNCLDGTRAISTGDRIRVNGSLGTIEILERVGELPAQAAAGE